MSIKDLFKNYKSNEIIEQKTIKSASVDIEGVDYLKEKTKSKERFVPPIDFSTASNFAKFGSAELYYEYAFKRISEQYPYDGTLAEREEFRNSSTYFDEYILENLYPRTNGYVNFGVAGPTGGGANSVGYYTGSTQKEYISFAGGPHTASGGMTGLKYHDTFDKSTLYDPDNKRENNLKIDLTVGNSVEFWLKKTGFDASLAHKETIFDLTGKNKHFRIYLSASADGTNPLYLNMSGTSEVNLSLGASTLLTSSIADSNWHHYAITVKSSSTGITSKLFVDSVLNNERTDTFAGYTTIDIESGTGSLGRIGALVSGSGDGQIFSASFDEFRFWKAERSGKQIGQNWFTQVGGGTDHSTDNTDLGVYFKFNEGVVGNASTDATILDYSGRLSNGVFVGYQTGLTYRSTSSAIVESGVAAREFKDPIIYNTHPTYISKRRELMNTGSIQDLENPGLFYHLLPSWLIEEDEDNGKNTKYICQIMASFFDDLYAQISYANKAKDENYIGTILSKDDTFNEQFTKDFSNTKPLTFSKNLLRHRGFVMPEIFIDSTLREEFRQHDLNELYTKDLTEVRNLIYQNLYNNLSYIYKSKGTEKSFRNFFRCFGIDSDIIKLHLYADNSTYILRDNYEVKSLAKKSINFYNQNHFNASVVQSGSTGRDYILSGSADGSFTLEAQVVFPKKFSESDSKYFSTPFYTASIFGFHLADTGSNNDFLSSDQSMTLLVASTTDRKNSKFILSGSNGIKLESSVIPGVYNNQKWHFGVKLKDDKYSHYGLTGSAGSTATLELYGVQSHGTTIVNTINITGSLTHPIANSFMKANKRIFVGSDKTNFTGSVIYNSDCQVLSTRYWESCLTNDELQQHALDLNSFGVENPYRADSMFMVENTHVPKIETLALNWDFESVTTSDSNGSFDVIDLSSGSTNLMNRYGAIGKVSKQQHHGKGHGFLATSTKPIEKLHLNVAQKKQPHIIYSSDMITIKNDEKEFFFQDDSVSDNFYSFEKSMQSVISDDILRMFSTVKDFNNLIGNPLNKWRSSYKELEQLKRLYFESVENEPDQEKFFEFYKWIDSSVSQAIKQLFPASARFSDGVANIIESHILERNKYRNKFPTVFHSSSTEGTVNALGQMSYNWRLGHAPNYKSSNSNLHNVWRRVREERDNPDANTLRKVLTQNPRSQTVFLKDNDGNAYSHELNAVKIGSTTNKIELKTKKTIHGGINYESNKDRSYYLQHTFRHGPVTSIGIPKNVIVAGVGEGQGLDEIPYSELENNPNDKRKYSFEAYLGPESTNTGSVFHPLTDTYSYTYTIKGNKKLPFNLISGTLNSGYNKAIYEYYDEDLILTNLHSDTVDPSNEIPMQGPFTQTHIGGLQSRHVRTNRLISGSLDDYSRRPESYRIMVGEHSSESIRDGAIGLAGPDYGGPYPDPTRMVGQYYRDLRAKSAVNYKNIKTNLSNFVVGNYKEISEIVSMFPRSINNIRYKKTKDSVNYVETNLLSLLPSTNVNAGMFAQKASTTGNIFGSGSNRFNDNVAAFANPLEDSDSKDVKSRLTIATKFSAPGGPEVQSPIFLDAINSEKSANNALPFRNMTVRGVTGPSGSGEAASVHVISNNNRREGLRHLLKRHTGKFGVDSLYTSEQNFHKQHRNNRFKNKEFELNVTPAVPGVPTSGSFTVRGIETPSANSTGSFVITGSEIDGTFATSSFEMSGAYYIGQQASASFTVVGRTIDEDFAEGSFIVSGAHQPTQEASGSFRVSGAYVAPIAATASFTAGDVPIYGDKAYYIFDLSYQTAYDQSSIDVDRGSNFFDKYEIIYEGTLGSDYTKISPIDYYYAIKYNDNGSDPLSDTKWTEDFESSYYPVDNSLVFGIYLKALDVSTSLGSGKKSLVKLIGTGSYDSTEFTMLDVYFTGSANSGRTLYFERSWQNSTRAIETSRTDINLSSSGQQLDGNWHSLVFTQNLNEITFYFDGTSKSISNLSSPSFTSGDSWGSVNKVEIFSGSWSTEMTFDLINLWSNVASSDLPYIAADYWAGGSHPRVETSASQQILTISVADNSSERSSNILTNSSSAATGQFNLDPTAKIAANIEYVDSKFFATKSATEWFDHVQTTMAKSGFTVEYETYNTTVGSANPKPLWLVYDHYDSSTMPNFSASDTLNMARFIVRSNVRSDSGTYRFISPTASNAGSPHYDSFTEIAEDTIGVDSRNPTGVFQSATLTIDSTIFEIDHHVTVTGSNIGIQTYTTTGKAIDFEDAAQSDGVSGIAASDFLAEGSDFSISFWVNKGTSSSGNEYMIVLTNSSIAGGSFSNTNAGFRVWFNTNNTLSFFQRNGGYYHVRTDDSFEEGRWYHITYTYTNSTISASIYVDSVLQTVDTFGPTLTNSNNFDRIFIGGRNSTSGFDGKMAEFAIWNKVLSSTEVQEIYNQGRSKDLLGVSATKNLLKWYKFSDISRNVGQDLTGVTQIDDDGFLSNMNSEQLNLSISDTSAIYVQSGLPTDTISTESFWNSLSSSIAAQSVITNKVDVSKTNGNFTLTATSSGASNNGQLTVTETLTAFTVTQTPLTGGSGTSGAQDGDSIIIDGTTFTIDADGTGTGNTAVGASGTNTQFWNRLTQSISSTDFTIFNIDDQGDNTAIISITASTGGAANNSRIGTISGDSFSLVNQTAGGEASQGVQDGDEITIDGTTYTINAAGTATTPSVFGGSAADNPTFWGRLQSSIIHETDFDTVSYVDNGSTATFSITSSVAGTAKNNQLTTFDPTSFSIVSNTAGGRDQSGAVDGHRFVIDSDEAFDSYAKYQQYIISTSSQSDNAYTTYVRSDEPTNAAFWNNMRDAITGDTNLTALSLTASYIDNGNDTATFTIKTTQLTSSFNGEANLLKTSAYTNSHLTFTHFNGVALTAATTIAYFNGGEDPTGSLAGDTINIDGTAFDLVSGSTSDPLEITVANSGLTDEQVWASMKTKIEGQSLGYTVTTGSDNPRTFSLIATTSGSSQTASIDITGSSFGSVSKTDGTFRRGTVDQHYLEIDGVRFEIDTVPDGAQVVDTDYVIEATGTNVEFWDALSSSLNTNLTDYDIYYTDIGGGQARFDITASVTGSSYDTTITTVGASFTSVNNLAGGVNFVSGVTNSPVQASLLRLRSGSTVLNEIKFITNPIVVSKTQVGIQTQFPIETVNTTSVLLWDAIQSSFGDSSFISNFEMSGNYVDNGDNTATFTIKYFETGSQHAGNINFYHFPQATASFPSTSSFDGGTDLVPEVSTPIAGTNFTTINDNMFVTTQLPATDYQYSWISKNATGSFYPTGSNQHTKRYENKRGIIKSGSTVVNPINFPTSSIFTL